MSRRTPTALRRRLASIRLSLILLALVPSVTLAVIWTVTTTQMLSEGLRLRSQTELSRSTGAMGTEAALALQQERSLSAAWLAAPHGSRAALDAQRAKTDTAVAQLVDQADAIKRAPARIRDRMYSVVASVGSLEYYRDQVDHPTDITAGQAVDQYTAIIDDQVHAFQELSQVDDGDLTSQAEPLVALEHAAELVSQEDAQLTLAWPSGHLDDTTWNRFAQLVHARRWLVEDQIVPSLEGSTKTETERILQSAQWHALQTVEDQVLAARVRTGGSHGMALPDARKRWSTAMTRLSDQYATLIRQQTALLLDRSAERSDGLLIKAGFLSAAGLAALLLCVGMSWRITRSLSRRLRGLRAATLGLAQDRLPDVVARLDRGRRSTWSRRPRRWTTATTNSARSPRRSTPPSARPCTRRSNSPTPGAVSRRSSSVSPGRARTWSTSSSASSMRWNAATRTRTSSKGCTNSTPPPASCAATRRTSSSSAVSGPGATGANRSRWSTSCAAPSARSPSTSGSRCTPTRTCTSPRPRWPT